MSLSAESLSAASREGRNLFGEIRLCQWSVVLLSAERLASKEVDAVLQNETFRKNLVVYGIDEAHVLVPWSVDFRVAYHQAAILHNLRGVCMLDEPPQLNLAQYFIYLIY